ncbi:unnamed protein product [Bursaphelenchus okinawaensis]|uniref:Ras-GEF domain-containing protein n=1 Tax=Bursaphelenchus okinawaensis TaxID=465554 RepID=A0A811LME0_9BILA|nr:unnamed protein product [Bursaphelenchus okinawaensis]CAG9125074.1 unnamed protein product [Bursaphelenchus okinawaensis]
MTPEAQGTSSEHEEGVLPIFNVKAWDAADVAAQITLKDLEVFKKIEVEELTSFGWNTKRKAEEAPNVNELTRRFNTLSSLTCRTILAGESAEKRVQAISYFIRLAKKLYNLSNYHSSYSVVSAMGMQPIFRLDKSWEKLLKTDRSTLDKLNEFFSAKNNFYNIRKQMEITQNPCVPYIGLYLTDLTFYTDKLKRITGQDEENVQENINNMLRKLFSFQDSNYDFNLNPQLGLSLNTFYTKLSDLNRAEQKDLFDQSVRLEPEVKDERRSSLPSQKLIKTSSKTSFVPFFGNKTKKYSVSPSLHSPSATLQRAFRRGHKKADSLDEAKILGVSNGSISEFKTSKSSTMPNSTILHRSPSSPTYPTAVAPWNDVNTSKCTYNQLNNEEDEEGLTMKKKKVNRSGSSVSLMNELFKKLKLGKNENESPIGSARLPRRSTMASEGKNGIRSADNTPNIGRRLFVMNNSMDERLQKKGKGFLGKSLDESDCADQLIEDSPLLFELSEAEIEGVFTRTQLRTKHNKPKLVRNHYNCFLELRNGVLLEFERKLMPLYIEESRNVFQSRPKKIFDLKSGDWAIASPGEDLANPRKPGFEIHSKSGKVYHYGCRNWTMANHWKRILDETVNELGDEKRGSIQSMKFMKQNSKESYVYEDTDIDGLDLEEQRLDEEDEDQCEVTRL